MQYEELNILIKIVQKGTDSAGGRKHYGFIGAHHFEIWKQKKKKNYVCMYV